MSKPADKIPIYTVLIKHEGKEYKYWCADYEAVEVLLKTFKKDLPSQGALIIPPSKDVDPIPQQA